MAFDNPPNGGGHEPPPPPSKLNDVMVSLLQSRLGALALANVELEARLSLVTAERDELAARIKTKEA